MNATPTAKQFATLESTGHLQSVRGSLFASLTAAIGEQVLIRTEDGGLVPGEVIGFERELIQIMPLIANAKFQSKDLSRWM